MIHTYFIFHCFFKAPESLTIYCRSLLDAGRSRFLCPYISQDTPPVYCGKEWDYIVVRRLAVLTDAEKKEFETKVSKNYLFKAMGIQECPSCKSFVERINKKDVRLSCSFCKNKLHKAFDFCWHCLHEWVNSSSTTQCGRHSLGCQTNNSLWDNKGGSRIFFWRGSPDENLVGIETVQMK